MKDDVLPTRAEVWAVAADATAIYLISTDERFQPGAWRSGVLRPIPGVPINEVAHRTVQGMLRNHGELDAAMWVHSTCWAPDDEGFILTYLAVLGGFGHVDKWRGDFEYVRDVWPAATPLTRRAYEQVGQPENHGATERPDPTYFHMLTHSIGHLRDQRDKNSTTRAALDPHWHRHLNDWAGTLGGQYEYGPAA